MAIIFGIDGIDVLSKKDQTRNQHNSFVWKLVENSSSIAQEKRYLIGPKGLIGSLDEYIENGYGFVRSRFRAAQRDSPILLVGYSRGAAAIISLAHRLDKRNIPIKAMLLFDAVDKHTSANLSKIANNTINVFHLRSSLSSKLNLSVAGKQSNSSTLYNEKVFKCTHSAMGGFPLVPDTGVPENELITFPAYNESNITYADDKKISNEVWSYLQTFRSQQGFS